MSTTLMPDLAISAIIAHPKNPRHNAVADDDMVASVRENGLIQPVVVAPHPTKADKFVPIAGHRRIDAARKAKLKAVPAVLRTDLVTEGQQIEAMIIENGHRLDLTPIEEAEGYAQLELLGYKPAQIAAAVGRNITTVRARLKLLKLSDTTRQKVHTGQLTIEHATAIGEFTDPDIVKNLEKAAAGGRNIDYEINTARQLVDRRQRNADKVAALLEAGATEFTTNESTPLWKHMHGDATPKVKQLSAGPGDETFPQLLKEHKGCLQFHHEATSSWPSVTVLCGNPDSHPVKPEPEPAWKAEDAKRRAEREQQQAEQRAAVDARMATVTGLLDRAGKITLPATVRDLLRVLLPQTLVRNDPCDVITTYQRAAGVHEDDRWDDNWWNPSDADVTKFSQHVDDVGTWSDAQLIRGIVSVLLADAEYQIDGVDDELTKMTRPLIRSYYALLAEAGHVTTPHDEEVLAALDAADQPDDPEAAAS